MQLASCLMFSRPSMLSHRQYTSARAPFYCSQIFCLTEFAVPLLTNVCTLCSPLTLVAVRHQISLSMHVFTLRGCFTQDPNSQHLGKTVWDASMVLAKYLVRRHASLQENGVLKLLISILSLIRELLQIFMPHSVADPQRERGSLAATSRTNLRSSLCTSPGDQSPCSTFRSHISPPLFSFLVRDAPVSQLLFYSHPKSVPGMCLSYSGIKRARHNVFG
jgi:hypothetical protein